MTYMQTLDSQIAAQASLAAFVAAIQAALPNGVTLTQQQSGAQYQLTKDTATITVQLDQLARELGVAKP